MFSHRTHKPNETGEPSGQHSNTRPVLIGGRCTITALFQCSMQCLLATFNVLNVPDKVQ